mgnify:CR=1 FL=1
MRFDCCPPGGRHLRAGVVNENGPALRTGPFEIPKPLGGSDHADLCADGGDGEEFFDLFIVKTDAAGGRPAADRLAVSAAELAVLFGFMGLTTGPLWARVSWGVWWPWDVRTTLALILEMNFIAYLLLRKYGGPGAEKLAAGLALFGMFNVPFVYVSVNVWRTLHPETTVVPSLPAAMAGPFWWCVAAYFMLFLVMLTGRRRLEEQRAILDRLHFVYEDD